MSDIPLLRPNTWIDIGSSCNFFVLLLGAVQNASFFLQLYFPQTISSRAAEDSIFYFAFLTANSAAYPVRKPRPSVSYSTQGLASRSGWSSLSTSMGNFLKYSEILYIFSFQVGMHVRLKCDLLQLTLFSVSCQNEREPRFVKLEHNSIVLTVFLNILAN